MNRLNALVVLPHIRIQNANMLSGPLSWGFPAMTAFLGTVHRLFRDGGFPVRLAGTGVICHEFVPQASRAPGSPLFALHLRRFPVNKDGSSASMIEEGRAYLDITLVLGLEGELDEEAAGPRLAVAMRERLQAMSVAGGSVQPYWKQPSWLFLPDAFSEQAAVFRRLRYRLLPGFALTERRDKLLQHVAALRASRPEASELDALLDLCRINMDVEQDPEDPQRGLWSARPKGGWFVPVPVGFRAISPLYPPGSVRNARDQETPFRFVESLYTLGEWQSPHRLSCPQDLLWHYRADEEAGLYLCTQFQGDRA